MTAALLPFVVLLLLHPCRAPRAHHRHLAETWSSLFEAPPPDAGPCGGSAGRCPRPAGADAHLAALRLELIKQQILKRLRLKEAPSVSRGVLPEPLSRGVLMPAPAAPAAAPADDHYYGRTEQVILFPESGSGPCHGAAPRPDALCLTLRFPAELTAEDVTSAQLWVYKEGDRRSQNHTLVVSAQWEAKVAKSKLLVTHNTSIKEGWVKINLLWAVKQWLEYSELPHTIHVACKTCGTSKTPISLLPENRPFLVMSTNSDSAYQRPKRNVDCVPGLTECCRESLYVSFADIGWSEWILQPPGYNAYFCRGSCSSAAALTASGSHYTTIMQRLLNHQGSNKKQELVPCCTATRLSPIQLLYMDNKQTITTKTLPNMAVDACGCM
ncbi:inhibin beta C chain [Ischnura elegans]|uniref:inhibin beta C chain n=1 Tax=Ischnura elegans TaxID=197161 RepID=UPI001ED88A2B|nr:inhibin beta C chain [Ischnura elegans]